MQFPTDPQERTKIANDPGRFLSREDVYLLLAFLEASQSKRNWSVTDIIRRNARDLRIVDEDVAKIIGTPE